MTLDIVKPCPSFVDFEEQCRIHMMKNGIIFDGKFIADGQIHRFSKDNSKDEFYSLHASMAKNGDIYWICFYGSWSGGYREFYYKSYENDSSIPEEERWLRAEEWRKKQQEIAAKLLEEKNERIRNAQKAWEKALFEPSEKEHTAYLKKKRIGAHGVKFGRNREGKAVLVIPLKNCSGEIQAVQYIDFEGEKRIYGAKKGNFHLIGEIREKCTIYVAEGYATAATVYEVTKDPTIVAFDCGNLLSVIENVRKKYPSHPIIIAADNDLEIEGNPGKTKAEEVAKKFGCKVAVANWPQESKFLRSVDFNDLLVRFGTEAVRRQLLKKKSHLIAINLGEFLATPIPPRKWILTPCFQEQSLNMLYAPRGLGKTFFALGMGIAIASGGQILKFQAKEPKRVLYVDGEMPASSMQERLKKLTSSSERKPDPSFFKLITPDIQEGGIRDISTKEGQEDINEHLRDVDFLILDNLSTLVQSKNENEAEDWIPVQQWLLSLRKKGISVLLIHHAGKSGQQRGSSKKEDILDTVISIRKPKHWSASDGAKFEIHFEKNREFDTETFPIEASLKTNASGMLEWTYRELSESSLELISRFYHDGFTQRNIAKEMNMSLGKVNNLIKRAKREGAI